MRGRSWLATAVVVVTALGASGAAVAAVGGARPGASPARLRAQALVKTNSAPADLSQQTQVAAPSAVVRRARGALRADLGRTGFLDTDARSGAVRSVGRYDGFLTGPRSASAPSIALGWVRTHLGALGLQASDLASLRLVRDYTSIDAVTHLVWEQLVDGVPLVDSQLQANVAADGRLVDVGGGARGGVKLNATAPTVGARSAYGSVLRSVGSRRTAPAVRAQSGRLRTTDFAGDGAAQLVAYGAGGGARLAWRVIAPVSRDQHQDALIDAQTGAIVRRSNLIKFASGFIHPNAPLTGLPGSAQTDVTFPAGWLPAGATTLSGNNAHAFLDVDDVVGTRYEPDQLINTFEEAVPASGEVHPSSDSSWHYPIHDVADPTGFCPPANPPTTPGCTWKHTTPNSWRANADEATTQLFYFVNNFHDHLAAAPIGFNAASGNFQRANAGGGVGHDPVLAQADDGANTDAGLPDDAHQDNANFDTLPDGTPGRMQMYLFEPIPVSPTTAIPFASVNGSDDPEVVYHEYTHGLSNRLITDAQGYGALDSPQSGAMGEAWSDWYAEDYLNAQGLVPDAAADGDVDEGDYVDSGFNVIRTEPMDCKPGDPGDICPGTPGTGPGGYTYGDFGHILAITNTLTAPEVHADGEIWGQTLWQLRQELIARHGRAEGTRRAEQIVTGAMRLSPPRPTYLDERNAILQADTVAGNHDSDIIWRVFASRGMGYFASTTGDEDTAPQQDFSLPPAATSRKGSIRGVVRDDRDRPLAGALVALGGHSTPGVGPTLQARSGANGAYTIANVPQGEYSALTADAPAGFSDARTGPIVVGAAPVTRDITVRRNYADVRAGASVPGFDLIPGPNHPKADPRWSNWRDDSGEGCGPAKLFDSDEGSSAETSAPTDTDDPGTPFDETAPRYITVRLAQPVNGAEIWIDPAASCGGLDGNSLGTYAISVSRDGNTFTAVGSGRFNRSDEHRLNRVPMNGAAMPNGVRYVRLTALRTIGGPDEEGDPLNDRGFMMVSELQVYAHPQIAPAGGTPPPPSAARLRPDLSRTARRLRVTRAGRVAVKVGCRRATAGTLPVRCRGTLTLRGKLPGRRGTRTLGRASFSIRANRVVTRTIRLSAPTRRALRSRGLNARLVARVRNPGARARTASKRVRLRRIA